MFRAAVNCVTVESPTLPAGRRPRCQTGTVGVRQDCRHYSTRSTGGDTVQRCRLSANEDTPFACPEACLFFEARPISEFGWQRFDDD